MATDSVAQLREFKRDLELPYTLLSDQQVVTPDALGVPFSSKATFAATLPLHPVALPALPVKKFLQPALRIWREGELAYKWDQSAKLTNLLGAKGRPSGAEILSIVQEHAQR